MNRTLQDTFNTIAQHLITQGRRAAHDGTCMYRGPDNTKCAVGVLIPDDKYPTKMEGRGVSFLQENYGLFDPDLTKLLSDLQTLHDQRNYYEFILDVTGTHTHSNDDTIRISNGDGTFNIPILKDGLALIAKKHGLEFQS